jgi:AcrR family transcriptional regulator
MVFVSSELPDPPWAKRRPRPERVRLSRDRIVDTALALLDESGYDALSMRKVAEALGTGAASLYAHVTGREDLLDQMVDRLSGTIHVPDPDPERWQEQLTAVMTDIYRAYREHPGLARATMGKVPTGPQTLVVIDRLLGIMRAGGLPERVIAYGADILPLYATAYAFDEGIHAEQMSEEEIVRYYDQVGEYFRSLPPDRFPHIHALSGVLAGAEEADPEARFRFGLDMLITGIAAQRGRQRS